MKLLIGCYTQKLSEEIIGQGKGIYYFNFDDTTGNMQLESIIPAINPSYLALSADQNFLYAVEEMSEKENPNVKSYRINRKDFQLEFINKQQIPGSYACHLSTSADNRHLLVANYGSGNIIMYPISPDGSIEPISDNVHHAGSGPNHNRQESPHAHMIYPLGPLFLVPDLGIDQVKAYLIDQEKSKLVSVLESDLTVNKGAGPRHLVAHPSAHYLFVFGELDSNIYVFKKGKGYKLVQTISSLPSSYKGIPSGSAIKMHPNGKFLYVANRGFDHLTIYQFDEKTGKLTLLEYVSTHGKTPRSFNIHPSGKWLLVGNQDSHTITVYDVDDEHGSLSFKYQNSLIDSPSCILWNP